MTNEQLAIFLQHLVSRLDALILAAEVHMNSEYRKSSVEVFRQLNDFAQELDNDIDLLKHPNTKMKDDNYDDNY